MIDLLATAATFAAVPRADMAPPFCRDKLDNSEQFVHKFEQ
jgi:hypothetical protein